MSILQTLRMHLHRTPTLDAASDIHRHNVALLDGGELDLDPLRGRPTLIVNTASKRGFTPQYAGLQALHEHFGERGLQAPTVG